MQQSKSFLVDSQFYPYRFELIKSNPKAATVGKVEAKSKQPELKVLLLYWRGDMAVSKAVCGG